MGAKGKRKKKNALRKPVIVISALALAFAAVFAVGSLFGAMPFSGISARVRAYISGDGGGAFPIHISAVNTLDADSCGGGFYVLSDTDIKLYDCAGVCKLTKEHGFTSPAVSTGEYATFVYDRSGTDYLLIKKDKVVSEGKSKDGNILTAAAGNGKRAFAVRSANATSSLYVTDRADKDVFIWNCAYGHIISVALSGNGKNVASASVSAVDGDVVSAVHIFGFDYSEELFTHTFEGEAVLRIKYLTGKLLYIFTDRGIYTVKGNKELTAVKNYYSSELGFYSDSDNGVSALALTKYGGSNLCELYVCGKRGQELFSKEIEADVSCVHTNGKYVFLLADKSVLVYNLKGELLNEIKSDMRFDSIFANGGYVYLRSSDKIERVYALGDETEKENG